MQRIKNLSSKLSNIQHYAIYVLHALGLNAPLDKIKLTSSSNMQAACCNVSIPTQQYTHVTGASKVSGDMPGVVEASKATCISYSK